MSNQKMQENKGLYLSGLLPHPLVLLFISVVIFVIYYYVILGAGDWLCSNVECFSTNAAKKIRIFIASPESMSVLQPSFVTQSFVFFVIAFVQIAIAKIAEGCKGLRSGFERLLGLRIKSGSDNIGLGLTLLFATLLLLVPVITWSIQTDIAIEKYGDYREVELLVSKHHPDKIDEFRCRISKVQNIAEVNKILEDMWLTVKK